MTNVESMIIYFHNCVLKYMEDEDFIMPFQHNIDKTVHFLNELSKLCDIPYGKMIPHDVGDVRIEWIIGESNFTLEIGYGFEKKRDYFYYGFSDNYGILVDEKMEIGVVANLFKIALERISTNE